jgi:dienelactone hydrolase
VIRGRLTPSLGATLAVALLLSGCAASSEPDRPRGGESTSDRSGQERSLTPPEDFQRLDDVVDLSSLESAGDTFAAWQDVVPDVEDVEIPSSADGAQQQALWLAPQGDEPRPLLVVLHSWSTRYLQHFSTPYGRWADQEGWAMVAPDFRGVFDRPEATGSDLAVQDVLDAVDWALERGGVDAERVFVVGFSGGGMMSLLMAGRHPDRFAGAVSWVPVHDLADWYAYNRDEQAGSGYQFEIASSCGGDPTSEQSARKECEQRSPEAHLDATRDAGMAVYLGHGLSDRTVPPDHAVRAFDHLADEDDRLGEDVRAAVARGELPQDVPGEQAESFFGPEDPEVLLARRSGPVTLALFEGEHDMVFHPGLQWMKALAERED